MSAVTYRVFSQSNDARLPVSRLVTQARAHFDGTLSEEGEPSPASGGGACRLSYEAYGVRAAFLIGNRPAAADDNDAARAAEVGSRGTGLADLAARCKAVWTIDAASNAPEWLLLEFCALLASVALGPILPPDGAMLLGVRSARERAQSIRRVAGLTA